jgi:hypothetical protein
VSLGDVTALHDRRCDRCGVVCWDRITHQRWHDSQDALVDAIDTVRNLLVAFEGELHRIEVER